MKTTHKMQDLSTTANNNIGIRDTTNDKANDSSGYKPTLASKYISIDSAITRAVSAQRQAKSHSQPGLR